MRGGAFGRRWRPVDSRACSTSATSAASLTNAPRAVSCAGRSRRSRPSSPTRCVSAFPDGGVHSAIPAPGGPRALTLGELERIRDGLADRVAQARAVLDERGERQEASRALLERMLLEPGRYKFVRVANRDLGEGGCGVWHVRPRLGLIGMLMGWWQVKLSSGCPLAS